MLRIAYVCADPDVPVFGEKGSAIRIREMLRALRRAGAEVTLFAARLGDVPPADLLGIGMHPLPAPPPGDAVARSPRGASM